ncbi:MAG TPA: sodium-translocating pyrophosphatase [Candidatus Bathyarchaeia archaeon]|nr:sodium-translocating pyrophosphatase [Candidatus Bathyarchaeia archaeon]
MPVADLFPLVPIIVGISLGSLVVAAVLVRWIMSRDTGSEKMREIASAIREGAQAYLGRQYKTISVIAAVFAIVFALVIRDTNCPTPAAGRTCDVWLGPETSVGFIVGALCSNLAGYIAMYISVRSNVRTASASSRGLDAALKVAFRGGMVFGLAVVCMSLLGITGLLSLFVLLGHSISEAPYVIVGFAFGASFSALFAQLGGGIYTKAADMSADLVGKVEAGIPEDDPRNPAVIADLVGDNVGDIAGRGADLFESITGENIGAMILGAGLGFFVASIQNYNVVNWVLFPLVARSFGLIAAIIGMFFVYAKGRANPFRALVRGLIVTAVLAMIGFYLATIWLLGAANVKYFYAAVTGIIAAVVITWITDYYTSYSKPPTLGIAKAAESGAAPGVATGLAVGMESTGAFILVIGSAILISYLIGGGLNALIDPFGNAAGAAQGVYGTAIATMGMLSVTPMILAMDGFGPITDNAAGIVEMSGSPEDQRDTMDLMDSVGNTTKALTKGYGVASAALSAFLLFSAFLEVAGLAKIGVNLAKPTIFVGGLIGAMLIFVFSALAVKAVGKTSAHMIQEVRRQFREIPGIMAGTAKPDYGRSVDISTRAALRNMIAPSLLVVLTPIIVGLVLGPEAVGALLMVGTVAGVLVALFFNNGGGALDNAKKYVEAGNLGGKGSPTHAATVIGDTLGDPLKDTAGPSLHVVVKLLNTITLALAPLFILYLLKYLGG